MKKLLTTLQRQGLSEKESRVYLALLKLGEATVAQIAASARVKRPTAYLVLEQLQQKTYVSNVKRGRAVYFRALSPHNLLENQYERYSSLEKAMPDLTRLYEGKQVVPEMSVFEGRAGIERLMKDSLSSSTDILAWADITLATKTLGEFYKHYVRERIQRRIFARAIFCDDAQARLFQKSASSELREVYLVPKARYPFKNEINIYDGKVAMISHHDLLGVIIQNRDIADTQRSIFQLGFEYAKLLQAKGGK